jgi:hypothetical protein
MFLLPTFPLVDQIRAHVIIWKPVSLGFRYSFCLLLSNGLIWIPKTSNICKLKVLKKNCGFQNLPLLVHLSVQLPREENEFEKLVMTESDM